MNATTYILHIAIVYYNIMNATTYILHITIVYYNMMNATKYINMYVLGFIML
jgi:hypothetical protein